MRFRIWGGIGDELALTPVIREWRARNQDETLELMCRWPELFTYNPHLGQRRTDNRSTIEFTLAGASKGNLAHGYARQLGLPLLRDSTPEMILSTEEKSEGWAAIPRKTGRMVALDTWAGWPRRRWPWEHWVKLVELLKATPDCVVIELGATVRDCYGDFRRGPLPGTDLCFLDKKNLRESVSIMNACTVFIGNDSGLAHAAAAIGRPHVVFYSVPWHTRAYRSTIPLFSLEHHACGTCTETCQRDNACLRDITPEDVHETLRRHSL